MKTKVVLQEVNFNVFFDKLVEIAEENFTPDGCRECHEVCIPLVPIDEKELRKVAIEWFEELFPECEVAE